MAGEIESRRRARSSVVVVHRNGERRLLDFLASASRVVDPGTDEIVVVDNHSTDGSIERVRRDYPGVTVIVNACNAGYARACNQGIAASSGEFVLLCNNDIALPDGSLEQFLADFDEYPRAGLIGAQLLAPDGAPARSAGDAPGFLSELGFKSRRRPKFPHDRPVVVGAVVGACLAVRRAALVDAGGLDDEFFFYYEETEWCVRLARHGWQVLFEPRVRIPHCGGASSKSVFVSARVEFTRSRMLYWRKTMPPVAVPVLYLSVVLRMLLYLAVYSAATLLTLGRARKPKEKCLVNAALIAWLIRGKPDDWGLPDKPRREP